MFDTYFDTFVPIYYQLAGTPPSPYWKPWCNTRWGFYIPGSGYIPHMFMDGYDEGTSYSQWESDYLARQPVTTDVTIDVDAVLYGDALSSIGTVCVEAGGTAKNMRIYIIQVLDHYPSPDHSPTYGRTYYRNCFRQVNIQDVYVAADSCVQVEHTFTVETDDLDMPENIGVVIFAQEPLSAGPAEVYQTGVVFAPAILIYEDGFETGDATGWSDVVP